MHIIHPSPNQITYWTEPECLPGEIVMEYSNKSMGLEALQGTTLGRIMQHESALEFRCNLEMLQLSSQKNLVMTVLT